MQTDTQATNAIFTANMLAVARCNPALAERLRGAQARADVTFIPSSESHADGTPVLSATIPQWGELGEGFGEPTQRALASKRAPLNEANRFAQQVDVSKNAGVVITGFGVGYHVQVIAKTMRRAGVVIVFEPDLELLRAVLERIDHSAWIAECNLLILTDASDEATISQATAGIEGILAIGVTTVDHPASQARLGPAAGEFVGRFLTVFKAARTTVITTLAQSHATLGNLLQNIDHYALGGGIASLQDIMRGKLGIVVSAGPSLEKNVRLLAEPGARDRCVIVATQTTLKPLLALGIKPHFVVALDYHDLSKRFYEGLSAKDVEGVTMVVEPKVNPAVTSAFPGKVLCATDPFLDEVLGAELARPMGSIRSGATVAHLAYYFARYLGCDPVALIGQDLAFTNGQYYGSGAAIHEVWASELGEFTTLEMREWERIARMKLLLRRVTDQAGNPAYTDEQMSTYLVQFQRDFKADAAAGLTTIDATEGGITKLHTTIARLADTLATHGKDAIDFGPLNAAIEAASRDTTNTRRRSKLTDRLADLRRDVDHVATGSREAAGILERMLACHTDQTKVNELIEEVYAVRTGVMARKTAYSLVERLNQNGAFNRAKRDRAMYLDYVESASGVAASDDAKYTTELAQQRRHIERDIANVVTLAEAAEELASMLNAARQAVLGNGKITRTYLPALADQQAGPHLAVWAIVPLREGDECHDCGMLDRRGDVTRPFAGDYTILQATLARLTRCKNLAGIVVLAEDSEAARRDIAHLGALGDKADKIHVLPSNGPIGQLPISLTRASRVWAESSWRGGPGQLTCYDELLDAAKMHAVCQTVGADAALLVGPDWCLVDPALCDSLITRYREDRESHRLCLTQAAVGLCGAVVDIALLKQLSKNLPTAGTHASIGGLLSYVPVAPMNDPIAKSMVMSVDPQIRDCLWRAVSDTPARGAALAEALKGVGADPLTADALTVARTITAHGGRWLAPLEVELVYTEAFAFQQAVESVIALSPGRTGLARLTLHIPLSLIAGDIEWIRAGLEEARAHGMHIHVRTDLDGPLAVASALASLPADVISVDVDPQLADCAGEFLPRVWAELTKPAADSPPRSATAPLGLPRAWLVPRLRRSVKNLALVEAFYDQAIMLYGAAVIDPASDRDPADLAAGIKPLTLPPLAARREKLARANINRKEVDQCAA